MRGKMWRYFQSANAWRYVEILPKLIKSYNATKHGATKLAPVNVTRKTQSHAWNALYGDMLAQREAWRKKRKPGELPRGTDLTAGTLVRLSKAKHIFETGYSYLSYKQQMMKIG